MRIVLDLSPEDVMSANDRPTHWARAERTRRIRDAAFTAWFRAGRPQFERLTCVCTVDYPDKRKRDAHNYVPTMKAAIDGMVHPPYIKRGLLPDDSDQYLTGPDPRPGGVTHGRYRFTFEFQEA